MKKLTLQKFTFMEMIALMLIIIILTTLLLPTVIKGREWGKSIRCKANMKAIYDGTMAYAADRNGIMPTSTTGTYKNTTPGWSFWLQKYDYVSAPKKFVYTYRGTNYQNTGKYTGYPADYSSVWACPSQEIGPWNRFLTNIVYGSPDYNTNNTSNTYMPQGNWGFYWWSGHYAMNGVMSDYGSVTYGKIQYLSKKLRGASSLGLFIESKGGGESMYMWYFGAWNSTGGTAVGSNLVWSRHWGRAYGVTSSNYSSKTYIEIGNAQVNTVFLDGHSEGWNNQAWWNKYLSPLTYASTPFTLIP